MRGPALRLSFVTLAVVAFSLGSALWAAWESDLTTDEPIHLEWSRRLLETGATDRGALHFNSKTPVVMANVLARKAVRRVLDTRNVRLLTFAARIPTVVWLAALLFFVFAITRRFVGEPAAHLAVIGCALEPSLTAHGALATVDAVYALATLLTVGAVLLYAERPSLARAALIGLALGFAFASKFTAFLLVPAVLLFPLARPREAARPSPLLVATSTLVVLAVTCFVVSAAYLFRGTGVPLSDVPWRSSVFLGLAAAWPGFIPPVPVDFLTGLDIVLESERTKAFNVVLLRQLYPDGAWFYFPLVWTLKTPLLLLAAQGAGLAMALRTRLLETPALRYLAVVALLTLAYFCLVFRMQIGFRFVLMCVPLVMMVAAAGLAGTRAARGPLVLAAVVLFSLAEQLPYAGNPLAFTNAAVQPKRGVFRLLADSNVDFGQNDERVGAWLAAHPRDDRHVEPVHVRPGENVVNFNLASGAGLFRRHAWLRANLDPRAHFRHTFLFFDVTDAQFERLLDEDRRLTPLALGEAICAEPAGPVAPVGFGPLPLVPGAATLACLRTDRPADLVVAVDKGDLQVGRPGWRLRDWERVGPGQEAWYRLPAGRHALTLAASGGGAARWSAHGGEVGVTVEPYNLPSPKPPRGRP